MKRSEFKRKEPRDSPDSARRKALSKANPPRPTSDTGSASDSGREASTRPIRKALAQRSKQASERDPLERVHFAAKQPARSQICVMCDKRAAHWHHLTEQQQIRVYVRGLRLPAPEARRRLRDLLRDERNLTPLCFAHHEQLERGRWPEFDRHVSIEAHDFAAELGPEWSVRLERRYPGSRGSAASQPGGNTT